MRNDADALVASARTATGLRDLGPDSFRAGLEAYWQSVTSEADLNELGAVAVRANVVGALSNRLRIVDWLRRHPEVESERIDSPLIVIGMFRAGTTLLSYLLDADPENRSLLRWEANNSVPPPSPSELREGPRVDAARATVEALESLHPRVATTHHEDADGPTECIAVMNQDFRSLSWEAITNVPSYSRWLLDADQRPAYEYHRRVLQILQSAGARGRWTLKSPHHALALEALTEIYPDAQLVLLHRDPLALCSSVCSLITTLSSLFSDADHTAYIAEHWVMMLEESLRRIETFRENHPEHPILDIQYDDLVRNPISTVERIYRGSGDSGRELSKAARAKIAAYVAAHPKGERGIHRHDLAAFGLEEEAIRERFSGYIERFSIAR